MGLKNIVKSGVSKVAGTAKYVAKNKGTLIIAEILSGIADMHLLNSKEGAPNDMEVVKADIAEIKSQLGRLKDLTEHYDNELAKSRRNLILVSIFGGIGIIAAILLAILL